MWETLSGSLYLRFENPGFYDRIIAENQGRINTSTEEIEKDLHRSLPEYSAYQSEEGIGALRREAIALMAQYQTQKQVQILMRE